MKFHDYITLYRIVQSRVRLDIGERAWYAQPPADLPRDPFIFGQFSAEKKWMDDSRPYYSVWPSIIPSLMRLPLNLDCALLRLPLPQLLVRFAVGQELDVLGDGSRKVSAIMVASVSTDGGTPGIALWADFGERPGGVAIYSYFVFALRSGQSLEDSLASVHYIESDGDEQRSRAALNGCVRLLATLCLMAGDPDLIEPEPLTADEIKFSETADPKLIAKAVRRGKRGWRVGAMLSVDPHYRRAHLALRWTGEGRKVPRIVAIKGTVVHRRKLAQVPTGHLDDCRACGKGRGGLPEHDGLCAQCYCDRLPDPPGSADETEEVRRKMRSDDRHRSGIGRGKTMGG